MHFCLKLQFTWQPYNRNQASPLYKWRKRLFFCGYGFVEFSFTLLCYFQSIESERKYEKSFFQSRCVSLGIIIQEGQRDIPSPLIGQHHDLCTWIFMPGEVGGQLLILELKLKSKWTTRGERQVFKRLSPNCKMKEKYNKIKFNNRTYAKVYLLCRYFCEQITPCH